MYSKFLIIGGLFFVLISFKFISSLPIGTSVMNRLNGYDQDLEGLYDVAYKVGYNKEEELNFFRLEGEGNTYFDHTILVFRTYDSPEAFSERVRTITLAHHSYLSHLFGTQRIDVGFIQTINEQHPYTVVLTDSRSEDSVQPLDVSPLVTRWDFTSPSSHNSKKTIFISIFFAQLPKDNLFWKDKRRDKVMQGNAVAIILTR